MDEESTAVNEPVIAEDTEAVSAPAEIEDSEVIEESDDEAQSEETSEEVDEPPKESPDDKPLNPKSQERFQRLANENREMREMLAKIEAQKAQIAQEQELLDNINPETGEYYTPDEAARVSRYLANQQAAERLEREQQVYNLAADTQQTLSNYPIFDMESPEFNSELTSVADKVLGASLVIDDNGGVVGSNIQPSLLYSAFNEAYRLGALQGQTRRQQAQAQMTANADMPSSMPGKQPSFDKLSVDEMRERLRKKGYDIT